MSSVYALAKKEAALHNLGKMGSIEKSWQELEKILKEHPDRYDLEDSRRAFLLAKKCHEGQKRKTGEPYIIHPIRAAITVANFKIDTPTVEAALLHDVVEDTPCGLEKVKEEFGEEVAFLVNGVTKLGYVKYRGVEEEVENLRKMMLAMSEDIRVIIVKLADRLDNMKTLHALPQEKQRRIALETLDLYAPIAHRLGIGELAEELEDLAFPYVYPKEYAWLIENVGERYEERRRYLESLVPILKDALEHSGIIPLSINSRAKHYYSLYQKLLRKDMNLEAIHDLVALRVIVKSVEECYGALGVVHAMWKPLPGRIKDYIALPKPNGYRSIHTTVFGPHGKVIEIQIRTQEMHEEAERGIAAHWHYTEAKTGKLRSGAVPKEFAWVRQLQKWQEEQSITDNFIDSLKIDFFKDRIFVITPKGDVVDLPEGATPVDFAYQIHTEIGNQCSGARVNGKIVPLDYRLSSGEVVEILTQKNKMPSEQWLEFVKTSFAKNKIREALRKKHGTLARASPQEAGASETHFLIRVKDRIGLIQDISKVFAAAKINISEFVTKERGDYPIIIVSCRMPNAKKVGEIATRLRAIKNVEEVSVKSSR
jgi:guanosine-3',5'-bis(diphosphate) 3'-pyrophosphohydrolase